ncbi:MAG: substrate-binding domain-containing protein [Anaerolineae bacterium]|nr:substrate-binding domain-containing protein [Anaerolineae bacterium]
MLTTFERRQTILRLLKEQPGIKVTRLAEILDVSEGTIRNDLTTLESEQKLERVRGGAVLANQLELDNPFLTSAPIDNAPTKRRIAHWAAEMVEDGDAILMDASSTVQLMVPFLKDRERLTIVTNGIETASLLATNPKHTVILVGGLVNSRGSATTSLMGIDILKNLYLRLAFVSAIGFSVEAGLTERSIEEAQLKQAMLAPVQRKVALIDSSKLNVVGFAPFAATHEIFTILTDSLAPAGFVQQMRDAHINLTICGENTVRSHTVNNGRPKFTIGFANQSENLPFAIDVRRGLERAVKEQSNIDLFVADNMLSSEQALHIADNLIERKVDLVIEYQIDFKTGSLLMAKFQQAQIPVIAVDIPMVGATFFGVDNYRAGHMAGLALGHWIQKNWAGKLETLLVLVEPRAGSLPEARIQGQLDGLAEIIGSLNDKKVITLDCGNTTAMSETIVQRTLEKLPDDHQIGVISFNDEVAFGALQAARKLHRESDLVIVGQGADRLIRDEIREPNSRLIGSTAYMPERYGEKLAELAQKIFQGESVPPAIYMEHVFINAENIDTYYPL